MNRTLETIGRGLSAYLTTQEHTHSTSPATDLARLRKALKPADVLLVEGTSRISTAIRYLTQSTWSHAALFVGDAVKLGNRDGEPLEFVEADVRAGVRAVSLQAFEGLHCRICRPVNLSLEDTAKVVDFAIDRIGHQYDLKNLFDLARYRSNASGAHTLAPQNDRVGKWRPYKGHLLIADRAGVRVGPLSGPTGNNNGERFEGRLSRLHGRDPCSETS